MENTTRYETKYVTETVPYRKYCISNYMKTHIHNEDTFERYIETGDTIETYSDIIREFNQDYTEENNNNVQTRIQTSIQNSVENNNSLIHTENPMYVFSPPITMNILTQFRNIEQPRTFQQIRENGLEILTRIGRLNLNPMNPINQLQTTPNTTMSTINRSEIVEDNDDDADNDDNEDEDEVINNPESEEENDSDIDWINGYDDDEEDSVS